jgi:hypothetical protein
MRIAGKLLALLALVLLCTSSASAQSPRRVLIQGHWAYVPTSGGLPFGDGYALGATLGLMPLPHIWIMGSGTYSWHGGVGSSPNWDNVGYWGMLGYSPVPLDMNGLMIFYAGAGGARFDQESGQVATETYFALTGGMKLVYDFSRHVGGTIDLGVNVALSGDSDLGSDTWTFPLGVGLALRF